MHNILLIKGNIIAIDIKKTEAMPYDDSYNIMLA